MTIALFQLLKLKTLETYLTRPHIQSINKSYWLHLQNISRIWGLPTTSPATPILLKYLDLSLCARWNHWRFSRTGQRSDTCHSGVLESAHTSSQQPTGKCSRMLQDGWHHSDSMNLAMVGMFIPQIMANVTNQGSPLPTPHSILVIRVFNIYQNTTACENLYYRKIICVWSVV